MQLSGVRKLRELVMGSPMRKFELAELSLLNVLDMREHEARPIGEVRDNRVPHRHPDVGTITAPKTQLRAATLGGGSQ